MDYKAVLEEQIELLQKKQKEIFGTIGKEPHVNEIAKTILELVLAAKGTIGK